MPANKKKGAPETSALMRGFATYLSRAVRSPLPAVVQEKTKHHVLDTISAMVSGSRLLPGRKAISFTKECGGKPEASVLGSRIVTTAENAALANGMLAHADETNDSHAPTSQHPGCAIVASALAMAEREACAGTSLLRAVALGYDVSCRINRALRTYDFRSVGHSTHSFGPTFGAAATAGALAGLSYVQTRYLLSYAAQQVSGISCWMRDTQHIEKAFDFGGMPARNGVSAASMVAHGFTGVEDVFSGERNFFVAYDESSRIGKAPDPDLLLAGLGSDYEIMGTNLKRWSVASLIQAPLDSLLDLIRTHRFGADDIERMTVKVTQRGVGTVSNRDMPNICMEHQCAIMLLDGNITFESSHDEKRMRDKRVLALRKRIEVLGDENLTRAMPSRQGIVEIRLKNGREFRHHTKAVRGTSDNPMVRSEVEDKAFHLMAPVLGEKRARALCAAIWNLEKVSNIRELRPLIRAS